MVKELERKQHHCLAAALAAAAALEAAGETNNTTIITIRSSDGEREGDCETGGGYEGNGGGCRGLAPGPRPTAGSLVRH